MSLPVGLLLALFVAVVPSLLTASTPQFPLPLSIDSARFITYHPTPKGDRIPDFSTVGYNYGNTPLPDAPGGYSVPVLVTLYPQSGDNTDRIQAAIDWISTRPLVNGFRGALLLKAGRWEIHSVNRITIRASGVVLRGEGDHPVTGTRLYAVGATNEANSGNTRNSRLIAFDGNANTVNTAARTLVDEVYVPGGTAVLPIAGHSFTVGQRIQVRWPGTAAWQKASFYNPAATADSDPAITFNRIIIATTPGSVTLDAPLTSPLDPAYARGYVVPVTAFNHLANVGVSHIYFESAYAHDADENHVWNALDFTEVEDGFVHHCTARYFAYSLAYINTSTRKITIDRSQCYDGISQLIGGRRYHFVLTGELGLVSNSLSRYGRHSFILNWPAAPGPNVFVDSTSFQSYNESGSHADWNNGGLWDNISELNASVGLQVKLERPSAYCVAWNVVTNTISFENMPLSPNWSFGTTTTGGGPAAWRNSASTGSFAYAAGFTGKAEQWFNGTRMPVRSLYENQLAVRLAQARNPHRHAANPPDRVLLPPVFRTPAQLFAPSGAAWAYQVTVSHLVPATRTPNFIATGLPPGLSLNATTGLLSGTVPTVVSETHYAVTLSARNIDGTTTQPLTLTVRPAGSPKLPLALALEVDGSRTTSLVLRVGQPAQLVPMVPASRLLAPMIVRANYLSDMNGSVQFADIPVPVRGVLPIEGLTSPVIVTYNGSPTLPTAPGYYDVVATLDDATYSATATGRLLITTGTAVTVTLGNTSAPTAASPVTATSTQPSLTPVITYDGASAFPVSAGHYTAKAVVADPTYFGSRLALISVDRPTATLSVGNTSLDYTGSVGAPTVTTHPPGLATRVSVVGQGMLPGTYPITAWIDDPAYAYNPIAGTMTIAGLVISTPGDLTINGTPSGAIVNFSVSASPDGFTANTPAFATPPSGSVFPVGTTPVTVYATDSGGRLWTNSFDITVFPGPGQLRQINPSPGVLPGTVSLHPPTGAVTLTGAGGQLTGGVTADLWTGTNDSNTFLSMPWQGDGVFTARLVSFTSPDASAKAGLIFRETTSTGSRYSTIHLLRSGTVSFQHKTAPAGATSGTNFFNGSGPSVGAPEWLRLRREGDTFTLSYSADGLTWTDLSTRTNPMTGSALSVGFVVAPRTGNTTATAVFDNIRFLTPLQSWRTTHFDTALAVDNASDLADPDADGAPNLLEYALDSLPNNPASTSVPSLQVSGLSPLPSFLSLTFLRARPELTYLVEASSTLAPDAWQVIATNPGTVSSTVPVTVTDSVSTNPRRFLRLRVTGPSEFAHIFPQ